MARQSTARYNNEKAPLSRDEMRRLHALKKKKQKKRKRLLTYVLLLMVIVGIGVALSLTVFFRISTIEVSGNDGNYYTDEQILESSNISVGDNLFLVNSFKATQTIEKINPYIGKAVIRKRIPDKIIISVTETQPTYAVQYGDVYILVSDQSKVLEQVTEKPENLTMLTGANVKSAQVGTEIIFDNSETMAAVKSFIDACATADLTGITSVDVSNLNDMSAVYDGRIRIVIGSPTSLNKKLPLAKEVIMREEKDTPGQFGSVDMTVLNKAYYKQLDSLEPTQPAQEQTTAETTSAAEKTTTAKTVA
ncbi:MAG: FtsQ-type POTRA domain-containing protein [Clostridiales bacterium]|nr:FtsQ-type POTRA domain-containing protein [Clostridiales bacterium]